MTSDSEARRADDLRPGVPSAEEGRAPYSSDNIVQAPDYVDLRPILASPAAAEMLLLARGQLNRAFRKHGLAAPDPLLPAALAAFDTAELDDPAAGGVEHATTRFREPFTAWAARMPGKLVRPVLDILQQTHEGLKRRPEDDQGAAAAAVLEAYDFLLARLRLDQDQPAVERRPAPRDRSAAPRVG